MGVRDAAVEVADPLASESPPMRTVDLAHKHKHVTSPSDTTRVARGCRTRVHSTCKRLEQVVQGR